MKAQSKFKSNYNEKEKRRDKFLYKYYFKNFYFRHIFFFTHQCLEAIEIKKENNCNNKNQL